MNDIIELPGGWGRLRSCRNGLFMYNVNDVYIGQSLERFGGYSEEEAHVLSTLLRPGDVAVEVGANIGTLTVPMAKAVGPGGVVLAYEPQRIAYQMLCGNVALNGLTNVIARQAALSDAPGTLHVPVLDPTQRRNFGDVDLALWNADTGVAVPAETLDSLDLGSCRLIKADVQGMEPAVLRGAANTIATHRPALYIENDQRDRSPPLIAMIRSMGYRMWWHTPSVVPRDTRAQGPDDFLVNTVSLNLLCFPVEAGIDLDGNEVTSPDDWPD